MEVCSEGETRRRVRGGIWLLKKQPTCRTECKLALPMASNTRKVFVAQLFGEGRYRRKSAWRSSGETEHPDYSADYPALHRTWARAIKCSSTAILDTVRETNGAFSLRQNRDISGVQAPEIPLCAEQDLAIDKDVAVVVRSDRGCLSADLTRVAPQQPKPNEQNPPTS